MKSIYIFILISLTVIACKKHKEITLDGTPKAYYQSNGNFLILQIGTELEFAYEYNLDSTQLNNDSLPISNYIIDDGFENIHYCEFSPNPLALFNHSTAGQFFSTPEIAASDLLENNFALAFDSSQFQLIDSPNNFSFSSIWSIVSGLDIVQTYRNALPNAKIGIRKIIFMEEDSSLDMSFPAQKYLVFLVK